LKKLETSRGFMRLIDVEHHQSGEARRDFE